MKYETTAGPTCWVALHMGFSYQLSTIQLGHEGWHVGPIPGALNTLDSACPMQFSWVRIALTRPKSIPFAGNLYDTFVQHWGFLGSMTKHRFSTLVIFPLFGVVLLLAERGKKWTIFPQLCRRPFLMEGSRNRLRTSSIAQISP